MAKIAQEFKEFISKGDVMSLAVGIIIGTAFTAIVNSLVADLINPLISLFTGGVDFSSLSVSLHEGKNAATFNYGSFIMAIINFLIIALVVFFLMRWVNKLTTGAARIKERVLGTDAEEEVETEPETKDCPYCLQTVPYRATRCPHCTSELADVSTANDEKSA